LDVVEEIPDDELAQVVAGAREKGGHWENPWGVQNPVKFAWPRHGFCKVHEVGFTYALNAITGIRVLRKAERALVGTLQWDRYTSFGNMEIYDIKYADICERIIDPPDGKTSPLPSNSLCFLVSRLGDFLGLSNAAEQVIEEEVDSVWGSIVGSDGLAKLRKQKSVREWMMNGCESFWKLIVGGWLPNSRCRDEEVAFWLHEEGSVLRHYDRRCVQLGRLVPKGIEEFVASSRKRLQKQLRKMTEYSQVTYNVDVVDGKACGDSTCTIEVSTGRPHIVLRNETFQSDISVRMKDGDEFKTPGMLQEHSMLLFHWKDISDMADDDFLFRQQQSFAQMCSETYETARLDFEHRKNRFLWTPPDTISGETLEEIISREGIAEDGISRIYQILTAEEYIDIDLDEFQNRVHDVHDKGMMVDVFIQTLVELIEQIRLSHASSSHGSQSMMTSVDDEN
jgi:hypothetical protein